MKLKPFLDANYAPLKDRHQYWFGGILIVKAVVLLSSALIPENSARILVFSVAMSSVMLLFWGQMVFCKNSSAIIHTSFFMNLAMLNITKLFVREDMSVPSYVLIGLAVVQFLGLILLKVISYCNKIAKQNNIKYCCRRERGEDDWELYLQASLLREEESQDIEESEDHMLGSTESLPTY